MFGKNKTPSEKYIAADNRKQKLRDKRSKLDHSDPNFEKKDKKFIKKIHKENVKMKAAEMESKQPIRKSTTVKTTINLNKTEKGLHFHGHYHNEKKKK